MTAIESENPKEIENIAQGGDVILVIGPEEQKLRVRSLYLKETSKPFSALFGPNWKEGSTMREADGLAELPLPEDDYMALRLICAVIHHRNELVPQNLPARDVLKIALLADKYDCVDALKFAACVWLWPEKLEISDALQLTAAAYLFREARAFKELTKPLILKHEGSYLDLFIEEIELILPASVMCKGEYSIRRVSSAILLTWKRFTGRREEFCKTKAGRYSAGRYQ